jgi:hypothetical protein
VADPLAAWNAANLSAVDRARALAALGVAQAQLVAAGGTGHADAAGLLDALQAVVDGAGHDGAEMVAWQLTTDPSTLPADALPRLAAAWAANVDRLRWRVRAEDPQPVRLELVPSPHAGEIAALARLVRSSTPWPIGVHVRETRPGPPPAWHWPIRIRVLEDPVSMDLANHLAQASWLKQGLAKLLPLSDRTSPAELLVVPFPLSDAAARLEAGLQLAPVACVMVLGGGADLPSPEVTSLKDRVQASTGASGLYVTSLNPQQASWWLDDPMLLNLAHNYQLDVCVEYGADGLFFATPELLSVSQLSAQILAIADAFEALPGNPFVGVPPGLDIPPVSTPADDLANAIRARAPAYRYDHETNQAWSFAQAGTVLDQIQEALGHTASANGGGPKNGGGGEAIVADEAIDGETILPPRVSIGRPRQQARVVSTGFASPDVPDTPLSRDEPLDANASILFWIEIGKPVRGAIDRNRVELLPAEQLPAGSRFQVVLFGYPDGLVVDSKAAVGEFELAVDGTFRVAVQPTRRQRDHRRMYFPVRTPAKPGRYRLRCSIYFRNVLVQSRVVTAHVGAAPRRGAALSARVDVQRARLLSGAELGPVRPHVMSVHFNAIGDAEQSVRFFASFDDQRQPFKHDTSFPALTLQNLITQAREAMRLVAWGSTKPWTRDAGFAFRYEHGTPDVANDLFDLMRKGRQLYAAMINDFADGPDGVAALRKLMLTPGRVQIQNSGPASELIPTAILYDYRTKWELGGLTLCPAFLAAQADAAPLEQAPCFKGECPSVDAPQVMCPSGFWGFRHAIGVPLASKWGRAFCPSRPSRVGHVSAWRWIPSSRSSAITVRRS